MLLKTLYDIIVYLKVSSFPPPIVRHLKHSAFSLGFTLINLDLSERRLGYQNLRAGSLLSQADCYLSQKRIPAMRSLTFVNWLNLKDRRFNNFFLFFHNTDLK
jgi:hypothetical protein